MRFEVENRKLAFISTIPVITFVKKPIAFTVAVIHKNLVTISLNNLLRLTNICCEKFLRQ